MQLSQIITLNKQTSLKKILTKDGWLNKCIYCPIKIEIRFFLNEAIFFLIRFLIFLFKYGSAPDWNWEARTGAYEPPGSLRWWRLPWSCSSQNMVPFQSSLRSKLRSCNTKVFSVLFIHSLTYDTITDWMQKQNPITTTKEAESNCLLLSQTLKRLANFKWH